MSARPLSGALAIAAALGASALGACSSGNDGPPVAADLDTGGVQCNVDSSNEIDQPFDGVLGATLEDSFCPRRDSDFWRVSVGQNGRLIRATANYQKLGSTRLGLEWLGPVGLCVTPATCPGTCPGGQVCDVARGGCRNNTPERCTPTRGCSDPASCASITTSLATALETVLDATQHRVQAVFPASVAGEYVVRIYDHNEQTVDDTTRYALTLEELADPDNNEPNDTQNLAIDLAVDTPVDAYLASLGDADWYRVVPQFATPAVIALQLSYPEGATITPTFTIVQDTFQLGSSEELDLGTTRERRATQVLPSAAPIFIRVNDTGAGSDMATPYTLTVSVFEDTDEAANRNDVPDDAEAVTVAAASASPATLTSQETIVASNDRDWYRIDRPVSADNSLVQINVSTPSQDPAADGFVLQLTAYVECNPSTPGDCPTGTPCLTDGTCIKSFVQRPSNDGPGDPQGGGYSPNNLRTQLPLFNSGPGSMYLLVNHLASTTALVPGFSSSTRYTLSVRHYEEPDLTDRTSPDNRFVERPLAPDLERDDFLLTPRTLNDGGGSNWSIGGPSGTEGFVQVAANAQLVANTCTLVNLSAFDTVGVAESGSVSVAVSGGTSVAADCIGGPASPFTLATGTGSVGVTAPVGTTNLSVLRSDGSTSLTYRLSSAATALPALSITAAAGGAPPTSFSAGGSWGPLRISLPAPAVSTVILSLGATPAASARIACADVNLGGNCVGLSPAPPGVTNPCTPNVTGAGAQASCQIAFAPGSQTFDVLVYLPNEGPVALSAADVTGTRAAVNAAATARSGQTFSFAGDLSTGFWATGVISYDGDNDFFTIPLGGFPAGAAMTIWARYPASDVDIKVQVTRGDAGGSLGFFRETIGADDCEDPEVSCSCDGASAGCHRSAFDQDLGVAASNPECLYSADAGNLDIWVNDQDANDGDINAVYEVRVEMTEGCPALCPGFVCSP